MTYATLLGDDLSGSTTLVTYTRLFHNSENRLSPLTDVSGSTTDTTFFRFSSFLGSGSSTFSTECLATVGNSFFHSRECLCEGEFDADFDILSFYASTLSSCPIPIESTSEKRLEDI